MKREKRVKPSIRMPKWLWEHFQRESKILSEISPTSANELIVTSLLRSIHKDGARMEIPLGLVDSVAELFLARGAIGLVRTDPQPDRPFIRFMWRGSVVFAYKLNESFAELLCDGDNTIKEEFSDIINAFFSSTLGDPTQETENFGQN